MEAGERTISDIPQSDRLCVVEAVKRTISDIPQSDRLRGLTADGSNVSVDSVGRE